MQNPITVAFDIDALVRKNLLHKYKIDRFCESVIRELIVIFNVRVVILTSLENIQPKVHYLVEICNSAVDVDLYVSPSQDVFDSKYNKVCNLYQLSSLIAHLQQMEMEKSL